jgi:hypothetical protein
LPYPSISRNHVSETAPDVSVGDIQAISSGLEYTTRNDANAKPHKLFRLRPDGLTAFRFNFDGFSVADTYRFPVEGAGVGYNDGDADDLREVFSADHTCRSCMSC